VMIDAGAGRSISAILENVASLELSHKNIAAVVATHCHIEHIGGIPKLRERTGSQVIAHELDAAAMEAGEVTRILPLAEISRTGGPTLMPSESAVLSPSDRVVTAILKIEHAEPNQLSAILRPMIAREGSLVPYGNSSNPLL